MDWSQMRRNCLLKYIIEGKIQGRTEMTSRRKQLLNDLKEMKRFWMNTKRKE